MTHQTEFNFDRDFDGLLVAIRELELSAIPLPPGRLGGVIELLTRILILSRRSGQPSIRASVPVIAGGITGRRRVSDRTVNNWTRDAKAMGLMEVIVASREFGGTAWNTWIVHWQRVRQPRRSKPESEEVNHHCTSGPAIPPVEVRNGPHRSESISDPGSETFSDPLQALREAKTTAASEVRPKPAAAIVVGLPKEPQPEEAQIEALLREAGWDDGARREARWIAHDGRCGVDDLRRHVRTWQANRSRLNGPGAIHARIRDGCWPAPGIRDLTDADIAALDQRRATEAQAAIDRAAREASDRAAAERLQAAREAAWQRLTETERHELLDRERAGNQFLRRRPNDDPTLIGLAIGGLDP